MRMVAVVLLFLIGTFLGAQERVTLDQAITAEYRVSGLSMAFGGATECQIYITLRSTGVPARSLSHTYIGATACQMLQALNKADLSKTSLQRRIIERMIADKVIAGTVSGTPE